MLAMVSILQMEHNIYFSYLAKMWSTNTLLVRKKNQDHVYVNVKISYVRSQKNKKHLYVIWSNKDNGDF